MARRISHEAWKQARRIVVDEGMSYRKAAEGSGIDLSSLQKRAAKEDWQGARRERASSSTEYRSNIHRLKSNLLEEAITSNDPQAVHAWRSVETAFPEHRYAGLSDAEKRQTIAVMIDGLVEYLGEHDRELLGGMESHLDAIAEHLIALDWSRR